MINFILGVYTFGFVLAAIIFTCLNMLGGRRKSFIGFVIEGIFFSLLWPITCWNISKLH